MPALVEVGRDSHRGIETFVTTLLAELVRPGCEKTVIARGDSEAVAATFPESFPVMLKNDGAAVFDVSGEEGR